MGLDHGDSKQQLPRLSYINRKKKFTFPTLPWEQALRSYNWRSAGCSFRGGLCREDAACRGRRGARGAGRRGAELHGGCQQVPAGHCGVKGRG